ncbi:MAG: hypothetical protein R3229_11525 [Alphaproteobacteria bacterium]|nr:hypothetical protein [Alphaproteobacteria bacterium]
MAQDDERRKVACGEHGPQPATFVCRHLAESLNTGARVGYHCSAESPDNPRPDAWCDACEDRRLACGGDWTGESEAFAGVTLLCGLCYDRARAANI